MICDSRDPYTSRRSSMRSRRGHATRSVRQCLLLIPLSSLARRLHRVAYHRIPDITLISRVRAPSLIHLLTCLCTSPLA